MSHHYEDTTHCYESAYRSNERELRQAYKKIREQDQEIARLRALLADLNASNQQPYNVGC